MRIDQSRKIPGRPGKFGWLIPVGVAIAAVYQKRKPIIEAINQAINANNARQQMLAVAEITHPKLEFDFRKSQADLDAAMENLRAHFPNLANPTPPASQPAPNYEPPADEFSK